MRCDNPRACVPSQLAQDTVLILKQADGLVMTSQRNDPVSLRMVLSAQHSYIAGL